MFSKAKIVVFIGVLAASAFAQKEDEAAKERRRLNLALLEQVAADARGLKLPENRALVAAKVGAVMCKTDEKQARKLFDEAAAGLIAAGAEGEAQTRYRQNYQGLIYGQEPRWSVLNLIGRCDASLAMDVMKRTRTPSLEKAVADLGGWEFAGGRYRSKGGMGYGSQNYAANEFQNEQRLIALAIEQDPSRTIALIRESIRHSVSHETLSLLKKLGQKDAESANRLMEEALQKLMQIDLVRNMSATDTLSYFLYEVGHDAAPNENVLRVPESTVRAAIEKLLSFWLNPDVTAFYGNNSSFTTIEKYYPDRAARVKQKFEQRDKQTQTPQQLEYSRLLTGEVPVDEMIGRSEKLPQYMRNDIYFRAAQKLAEAGNFEQAEKLIENYVPEDQADNLMANIVSNRFYNAIGQQKFEEANSLIDRLPDTNQKVYFLVNLANSVYQKDPEKNDKWALSILVQARAIIPDEPQTYEDFAGYFNIAAGGASVDTEGSFRMAEEIVPVLNEFANANATLARLRNSGNFRNGEFQITNGQQAFGVSGLEGVLSTLKEKDFERVVRITNAITRLDARLAYQLQLINENELIVNLPINTRSFNRFEMDGE
jgi:hypothetical protein